MLKQLSLYLMMFLGLSCQAQSGNQIADFPAAQKIDAFMTQLSADGFSGSVLVAYKGKVYKKGFGLADREQKIPVTSSTILETGSVTKQFTGAAILKLEMMGKLSVTDPINKYLKNVPADKSGITIHHLLTHSSGIIPNIVDDYTPITRDEYIQKAMQAPLSFRPGTSYDYANAGYSLLAAIIEIITGDKYETFLNKNLFEPAGMKNTGYQIPAWDKKNVAVGYRGERAWGRPNEKPWAADGPYWNLRGNGGILSNVEDMYKWHLALVGDKILSKEAKAKYYTRHIEEGQGGGSYYGYGWAIFPTPRNTWLITHNGGNGILFCDFLRYLDEDVTIIVMCNALQPQFRQLAMQIARTIFIPDHQPSLPKEQQQQPGAGSGVSNLSQHPQGKLLEEFITVMKGGKDDALKSFISKAFSQQLINMVPIDRHLNMLKQVGNDLKNLEIGMIAVNGEETQIGFKNSPMKMMIVIDKGKIAGLQMGD